MRFIMPILALLSLPVSAAPFDYLLAYSSEADAKADPVVSALFLVTNQDGSTSWRGDICFPGLMAWDSTKDVTNADGSVTHTPYDSNWLMLCNLPARSAALEADSAVHLIYDAAMIGRSGILYSWLPADQLQTVLIQPVPQGRNYLSQ